MLMDTFELNISLVPSWMRIFELLFLKGIFSLRWQLLFHHKTEINSTVYPANRNCKQPRTVVFGLLFLFLFSFLRSIAIKALDRFVDILLMTTQWLWRESLVPDFIALYFLWRALYVYNNLEICTLKLLVSVLYNYTDNPWQKKKIVILLRHKLDSWILWNWCGDWEN